MVSDRSVDFGLMARRLCVLEATMSGAMALDREGHRDANFRRLASAATISRKLAGARHGRCREQGKSGRALTHNRMNRIWSSTMAEWGHEKLSKSKGEVGQNEISSQRIPLQRHCHGRF
jgi:hypothetical protein